MQIKFQNILLRDMRESDIADEIRWHTTETEWAKWDAPWEMEEELRSFDPEKHREKELAWIAKAKPDHRLSLEIETADGVHIGAVSAYCIDEDFNWRKLSDDEDRRKARWAVGVDICDSAYWSGGWGTQALTAWVKYHLEDGYTDLYTQTWSGNGRMVGLAEKLGFRECCRKAGIRSVRGGTYDGLTFRLDRAAFEKDQRSRTALGWKVELRETGEEDLPNVARLWNDGAVMYYVGFPNGLGVTLEHLREQWLPWVHRGLGRNHWSIYAEGVGYCGETFYDVDETGLACMDIKLLPEARGKAIAYYALDYALGQSFAVGGAARAYVDPHPENRPAWVLYERLGFRPVERPAHLEPADTYLELSREEYLKNHRNF